MMTKITNVLPETKANGSSITDSFPIQSGPKENVKSVKQRTEPPKRDNDEREIFIEPSVSYDEKTFSIRVKNQRGNWSDVTNGFFLFIRFVTTDEYENKIWIIELQPKKAPPILLEVPHDDFRSAIRLRGLVLKERYALQINDNELIKLQDYLFRETKFGSAIKINRFGFHPESEVFFFANAAVKDGKKLAANEFNIVESLPHHLCAPTAPKRGNHQFTLTDHAITFNEWYCTYCDAHEYENAFLAACFYIMSLFRDITISHNSFSPILYVKGRAGSGKSSIVRSLTNLFGFTQDLINLKTKNTGAALVKLMSQASNALIWMDEFYNDFEFEGVLQAAYDNAGYHLSTGVGTRETTDIDIKSALALTSNDIPKNPAFFSRCVYIPINTTKKTEAQRKAYYQLQALEKVGLGAITVELLNHRPVAKAEYAKSHAELSHSIRQALQSVKNERIIENATATMAQAYTLNVAGLIGMTEYGEKADILAEFTRMAIKYIERQDAIMDDESHLAKFFDILQTLKDERKIQNGIQYRIDGDRISFNASVFVAFQREHHRVHHTDGPSRDQIEEGLKNDFDCPGPKRRGYHSVRFKPGDDGNNEQAGKSKNGARDVPAALYSLLRDRFSLDLE